MSIFIMWCMRVVLGFAPRTLVLCPSTLISTWVREIEAVFGKTVRVIDMNGPNAISLLAGLKKQPIRPDRPEVWVCGLHRMKTASTWREAYFTKKTYKRMDVEDEYGDITPNVLVPVETAICPKCSEELQELLKTRRNRCRKCGNPLWGPPKEGEGRRGYAPVDYIRKYLSGYFHLLLVDEVHKLKGSDTIQGAVLGQLAGAVQKTLVLTGTLSDGKASNIFTILQRVFALNYTKEERRQILPPFDGLTEFVSQYGCLERVRVQRPGDPVTGRATPDEYRVSERPGISPEIFPTYFADSCAFLRISDVADALPGYDEILEMVDLDDEVAEEYARFEPVLRAEVRSALRAGDTKVLGQMIHALLAWPDMPQKRVQVLNRDYDVVATAKDIDIEQTNKDRRLIELVKEAKEQGRLALIYAEYTGKWAADKHLARILESEGLRPLVLKGSATGRLEWIEKNMASGKYDCLITHVKKVESGLNLYDFPTIIFWQTTQSVYFLRQACRRSWRPGQTKDVRVHFLINRNTMQEMQMVLCASKLHAALILEGELTDNGLVALSDLGDSMTLELARALVGESELGGLEETFQMYRIADNAATAGKRKITALSASGGAGSLHTSSAKLLGAICGLHAGTIRRRFRGLEVSLKLNAHGLYDIIVNGKNEGVWSGDLEDTVMLDSRNLMVMPQPALTGMVLVNVFRLAAAA